MRSTRQKSKVHASPEVLQIPEEEEPPQEPTGDGAVVVAINCAAAAVEITVRIAKARLHCPVCTLLPSSSARSGTCGVCRLQLRSTGQCFVCGRDGGYARSTAMEGIARSAKVLCPHDAYGCRTYVTHYDAAEHQRACPHAPCLCTEPGCGFAGPPARTRSPWTGSRYGAELRLRLPQSDPAQHRRLLAAGDDEGGEVFFLAVGAQRRVAHVRPRFACTIRAGDDAAAVGKEGSAESVVLKMAPVPRSASPGETSMEEVASLVVLFPGGTLHAAVPGRCISPSASTGSSSPVIWISCAASPDSNGMLDEWHDSSCSLDSVPNYLLLPSSDNEHVSRLTRDRCWDLGEMD